MSEKITLTLKRETLEQTIDTQRQSVEFLSQAVFSHKEDRDAAARIVQAQCFFISFLERHLEER